MAMPFQFFVPFMGIVAFTGLNITGCRADDVMPWLLIQTGMLYC